MTMIMIIRKVMIRMMRMIATKSMTVGVARIKNNENYYTLQSGKDIPQLILF